MPPIPRRPAVRVHAAQPGFSAPGSSARVGRRWSRARGAAHRRSAASVGSAVEARGREGPMPHPHGRD